MFDKVIYLLNIVNASQHVGKTITIKNE